MAAAPGRKIARLEFLYRHPKILDVQVFGIPDPRYGEELCAWIRLRDGEVATIEELRAFCETYFGPHGGYAQQYLFHHARKGGAVRRAPAK